MFGGVFIMSEKLMSPGMYDLPAGMWYGESD